MVLTTMMVALCRSEGNIVSGIAMSARMFQNVVQLGLHCVP